jgi:hypothetical protein
MLTPLQYGGHLMALQGEPIELKKLLPAIYQHWWAIFEPQKMLFTFVTIL